MKKTFYLLGLFFLFIGTCFPVLAADTDGDLDSLLENLDTGEDYKYEFPEIEPSSHMHLGYSFADLNGSSRVFEYEFLEDSVMFGGDLRLFNFPHRFYLDVDFENKEDYFGEIRYAYGDLLLFRWLGNSFYHNLENIRLYDFSTPTPTPLSGLDGGNEYGINAQENKFHLMVKAPSFPLHVYFDGFFMVKDGDMQQRNLLGSGYFDNIQRTSRSREVDYFTEIYKIGANSHLSLIEVDIAHTEKRFSVDKAPSLQDTFYASVYLPAGRPTGIYEHSRIPDLEGSGNSLRIHSSYTGKWVASASLYQNKRENNYSGAESDEIVGGASLMWTPLTSLSFAFQYTHRDLDNETPANVTVTKLDVPVSTFTYPVKLPVSSNTDTVTLTGRYKPFKGVTFRAKYNYQQVDRTNAVLWNLEPTTRKNTITLSADSRLHSKVLFNAKYVYQDVTDPAYNTEPEYSHTGRLGLTWLPHQNVSFLFSYDINHQERDNLNFIETDDAWHRETDLDNFLALGTFQVTKKFTLSTSYSFLQYKVLQDLVYADMGGFPQVDKNVPMEQRAHVVTFSAYYRFTDAFSLLGDISTTRSAEKFSPNSDTQMEQRYLLFHLGGEYKFNNGLSLDLNYRFGDFEDALNNIYDDIEDGKAHIVILSASRKW